MKRRVLAQLDNVQALILSTVELCQKSNKSKVLQSTLASTKGEIGKTLESISESKKRRSLTQTKKALVSIDNTFSGLLEGLASKELSVKEFRSVCSNLQTKFVPKFVESLSSESEKIISRSAGESDVSAPAPVEADATLTDVQSRAKAAIAANAEWKEKLAEAANTIRQVEAAVVPGEDSEDEEDDKPEDEDEREARRDNERIVRLSQEEKDVKRRFARMRAMRSLLPQSLKAPYELIRLPVAPIFETSNASNPYALQKAHVPFTEVPMPYAGMERYVIFEQQIIMLVSRSAINASIEAQVKGRQKFVRGFSKNKRGIIGELQEQLTAIDEELKVERKKQKKSKLPKIVEIQKKIDEANRSLNAKLVKGRTDKERELSREIFKADKTEKESHEQGFLLAARNAFKRAEDAQKALPVDKRTGIDPQILKTLEEAEARYIKLNRQLNKLREARMDAADRTLLAKNEVRLKKIEELRKEEDANTAVVRKLEEKRKALQEKLDKEEQNLEQGRKAVKKAPVMKPEDYAQTVLSIINERGATQYELVTKIHMPNPRNLQDIICFWIMPKGKLAALLKASGGKAKVRQWSFPWDDAYHVSGKTEKRTGWTHISRRPLEDMQDPKGRLVKIGDKVARYDMAQVDEFLEYPHNAEYREKFYPHGWKSKRIANPKRPDK
jgi:hypothetical protein